MSQPAAQVGAITISFASGAVALKMEGVSQQTLFVVAIIAAIAFVYMLVNSDNATASIKSELADINLQAGSNASHVVLESVIADHNAVGPDGRRGMAILVDFKANGLHGIPCSVAAYFSFDNGDPLIDMNNAYRSSDGQVATSVDFTPPYDQSDYKQFRLFMPHDELHMGQGVRVLRFRVEHYIVNPYKKLAVSNPVEFTWRST